MVGADLQPPLPCAEQQSFAEQAEPSSATRKQHQNRLKFITDLQLIRVL